MHVSTQDLRDTSLKIETRKVPIVDAFMLSFASRATKEDHAPAEHAAEAQDVDSRNAPDDVDVNFSPSVINVVSAIMWDFPEKEDGLKEEDDITNEATVRKLFDLSYPNCVLSLVRPRGY